MFPRYDKGKGMEDQEEYMDQSMGEGEMEVCVDICIICRFCAMSTVLIKKS